MGRSLWTSWRGKFYSKDKGKFSKGRKEIGDRGEARDCPGGKRGILLSSPKRENKIGGGKGGGGGGPNHQNRVKIKRCSEKKLPGKKRGWRKERPATPGELLLNLGESTLKKGRSVPSPEEFFGKRGGGTGSHLVKGKYIFY